jgi:hypothetical protein
MLRRPLFSSAAVLAVVAVSGAGYAAGSTSTPDVGRAAFAMDAADLESAAQDATSAASERRFQQEAAAVAQAERATRLAAERAAAAEAARQAAAEAERKAREEAERKAAAARQEAAEQASRAAARDPRGAARAIIAERGWGGSQFGCLDTLWQRESGWDHTADNPSSSAYGIPQALPGEKMAVFGDDWRTNPVTQIRWGLDYIESRYGSPCAALQHSNANNWY